MNPRALPARAMEVDDKELGIGIRLPAYSALFFACKKREPEKKVTPRAETEKSEETKAKQKPESLLEKAADAAGKKAERVAADVAGAAKKRIDRAMGMENKK